MAARRTFPRAVFLAAAACLPITTNPALADLRAGYQAAERGEFATAIEEYRKDAALGNPEAMFQLGVLYAQGKGAPKNAAEALRLFERAAATGHRGATTYLGVLYWTGDGVPFEHVKAFTLMKKAAELGDPIAQNNLAMMLDQGVGTTVDRVKAFEWAGIAYRNGIEQAARLQAAISAKMSDAELAQARANSKPPAPPRLSPPALAPTPSATPPAQAGPAAVQGPAAVAPPASPAPASTAPMPVANNAPPAPPAPPPPAAADSLPPGAVRPATVTPRPAGVAPSPPPPVETAPPPKAAAMAPQSIADALARDRQGGPGAAPSLVVPPDMGLKAPPAGNLPPPGSLTPAEAVAPPQPARTTPPPAIAPTGPAPAPPAPAAASAPSSLPERGVLRGHIVSMRSRAEAEESWSRLQKSQPALFGGIEARFTEVDLPGKGKFVRLLAGRFTDRAAAQDFCQKVRAQRLDCNIIAD